MMQMANLFDGVHESGAGYFNDDHPKIEDPTERAKVVEFLNSGEMVLRTTGLDEDRVDPARGRVVPMSLSTDGEWVWSDMLTYYVETYGYAPEPAFLQHMANCNYLAAEPDDAAIDEALDLLNQYSD